MKSLKFSSYALKSCLVLVFILVHMTNVHALLSGKEPDGILAKLKTENKNSKTRADLLIDLGTYYLMKPGELEADLKTALHVQQQAMALCKKLYYPKGIARSLLLEGQVLCEKGDHEKSLIILQKAIDYSIEYNLNEQIGTAYRLMSINFSNDGEDLDKKISYVRKAIPYFEKGTEKLVLAKALENLGDLYMVKDDNANSLHVLKQALSIYNAIGFKETQGVYNILGYVSFNNKDNINALKYLLTALRVAESLGDTSQQLSTICNRLGVVYDGIGKPKESIKALEKALAISEAAKDSASVAIIKLNLLMIYRKDKRYNEAKKMLKSIDIPHPNTTYRSIVLFGGAILNLELKKYSLAGTYLDSLKKFTTRFPDDHHIWQKYYTALMIYNFETGNYQVIKRDLMNNKVLKKLSANVSYLGQYELYSSKTDSALGDNASALRHYKNYSKLRDSLTTADNSKQLSELQLQFETERKDKNIAFLTQKSQLQQTRIRSQEIARNAIITGLIVLLIFFALLFNRYRLKQRANKKLEIKQAEINEQNNLLQKLLTEKEWLLKEIHHRAKNNLQVIISLLNTQSAFLDNEDALMAIQNSQRRMHAMSLIHQKLYQSDNLASIDMVWYIKELISFLKDSFGSDNKIKFILDTESIMLDVAQAVPLGLILNEAITNAIKYAFPDYRQGEIFISLKPRQETHFLLSIIDNGIGLPMGFDPEKSNSIGMNMMQGLSEQLDGDFKVKSENGLALYITFSHNSSLVSSAAL